MEETLYTDIHVINFDLTMLITCRSHGRDMSPPVLLV